MLTFLFLISLLNKHLSNGQRTSADTNQRRLLQKVSCQGCWMLLKTGDGTTTSNKSDKGPKVPSIGKASTSNSKKNPPKKNKKGNSTATATGKKKSKSSKKKKLRSS
ncbi:hypothetical protein RclHR1_08130014 [Rhizophagus clarus]|uniref:Uncharacterized protein n=1 Tax=Rhizophagus clarus TaxID=94130 RepID=A0A2Z6S1U3_9GLOM|nr:hypothetical protein RclHR1_08130014 [Rhizophagus clarus]GES93812.1 hypothetical protein RCL_jg27286.t1 [Rhizophagus clarus]